MQNQFLWFAKEDGYAAGEQSAACIFPASPWPLRRCQGSSHVVPWSVALCEQGETHKLCSLTATLSCCYFCNLNPMSFLDFFSPLMMKAGEKITASEERDQQQAFPMPAFTPVLDLLQNPKYFEMRQYLGIMIGVSLFHLGLSRLGLRPGLSQH